MKWRKINRLGIRHSWAIALSTHEGHYLLAPAIELGVSFTAESALVIAQQSYTRLAAIDTLEHGPDGHGQRHR